MRPAFIVAALAACDWDLNRMSNQPRCEADEATPLFPDGDCNRLPPDGVVPWRARAAVDPPPVIDRALIRRGRNRYDIFCAPCHGLVGDGRSDVAENMVLRKPPSLHEPRLVAASDRYLVEVIGAGFGLMPAYGADLPPSDRWAVATYVRVLQRSQNVPVERLPPVQQREAARWPR